MDLSHGSASDMLTRTKLAVAGEISVLSVARLVHALQRVPGVLLVEFDEAMLRATVAHDSGVSPNSLLAAAVAAGQRTSIVRETRAPAASAETASPAVDVRKQRILTVIGAIVLLLSLIASMNPAVARNHILIPVVLAFIWAFVIARSSFKRRT